MYHQGISDGFWNGNGPSSWDVIGDLVRGGFKDRYTSYLTDLNHQRFRTLRQRATTPSQVARFGEMLDRTRDYHQATGGHLHLYGDLGELFGAITYGIRLDHSYTGAVDGHLGRDAVMIKTLTPFADHDQVTIHLDVAFSKLLLVRIDETFAVSGRMIERQDLNTATDNRLSLTWDMLANLDRQLATHARPV